MLVSLVADRATDECLDIEGFLTLITGVVGILIAAVGIWRSGCLSLLASVASISFALVAIGVSGYRNASYNLRYAASDAES